MSLLRRSPADLVQLASELLHETTKVCAPGLEQTAKGPPPLEYVTEVPHLATLFREKLPEAAKAARPRPEVSPSLGAGRLRDGWPRLGPFDASLRWGAQTVFAELKCRPYEDDLEACAWDALKCAFAIREGFAIGGVLVAGAPAELWDRQARGCELFTDDDWKSADIRQHYTKGFTKWERDGYKPVRVPERFRTIAVQPAVPFSVNGAPWRLAVCRIEPLGEAWFAWPPFL